MAHHFGEVAPLSPLGNLALVPIVELAVVPVGLAGAAAGAIWPPLGQLPLAAAGFAARAALAVADGFRVHAPLWLCRTPNALETAALTGAGALALVAAAVAGPARRRAAAGALAAALLAIGSLAVRDFARRHARDLTVTFLDVGQGDAAVVEAPGARVMLIDGGGVRDGSFDPGARIVEPFLRARGIGRIDVVALSHPHPDHLNGLFRILQRFEVGAFWSSGDDGHNPEYRRLVALARQRAVAMPDVAETRLGGAAIVPLGPFESAADGASERIAAPAGLTVNDASLVLRVGFAGRGVLFAGDLEADGEGELAGRRDVGQIVAADVLKVPHHGSRTSSSPELVDAVAPALAVISLGWRNQFRFPAPEVVARYAARGARVLRTDRDGAITVAISPAGALTVRCERGLSRPPRRNRTRRPADDRSRCPDGRCHGPACWRCSRSAARPPPDRCSRAPSPCRRPAWRRWGAASWIGRRATSRSRSSSSRGSGRPKMAWAWSPFVAATGRAPRSGSAPRSRSTKISRRPTSTWRRRWFIATRRPTRWSKHGRRSPSIPGYADARLLTAELLLRLGKLDDARWELEKLCAAAPERADAHAASALVLARLGRTAAAEQEARRALAIDPQLPAAHRARAEILRRAGDLEGASRELEIGDRVGRRRDRRPPGARHRRRRPRAVGPGGARAGDAGPGRAAPAGGAFRGGVRRPRARRRGESAVRAADAALALRARYPEARLVRADALSRLGREAEMRRELEQVSGRGAAGDGRRTRPRRTKAARACVRS